MSASTPVQTPIIASPADFSSPNDIADNRLSLAELEDLRDAFRLFDTKNVGKVDAKELQEILAEMLQEKSNSAAAAASSDTAASSSLRQNLQRLWQATKSLPAGSQLTEEYFIHLITAADASDPRSDIERVFDLFSGGKDYISLDDLSKVADDLGEDMTKEELEEMIERAAPNGGRVTIEEFSEIMNKKLFS